MGELCDSGSQKELSCAACFFLYALCWCGKHDWLLWLVSVVDDVKSWSFRGDLETRFSNFIREMLQIFSATIEYPHWNVMLIRAKWHSSVLMKNSKKKKGGILVCTYFIGILAVWVNTDWKSILCNRWSTPQQVAKAILWGVSSTHFNSSA